MIKERKDEVYKLHKAHYGLNRNLELGMEKLSPILHGMDLRKVKVKQLSISRQREKKKY